MHAAVACGTAFTTPSSPGRHCRRRCAAAALSVPWLPPLATRPLALLPARVLTRPPEQLRQRAPPRHAWPRLVPHARLPGDPPAGLSTGRPPTSPAARSPSRTLPGAQVYAARFVTSWGGARVRGAPRLPPCPLLPSTCCLRTTLGVTEQFRAPAHPAVPSDRGVHAWSGLPPIAAGVLRGGPTRGRPAPSGGTPEAARKQALLASMECPRTTCTCIATYTQQCIAVGRNSSVAAAAAAGGGQQQHRCCRGGSINYYYQQQQRRTDNNNIIQQ